MRFKELRIIIFVLLFIFIGYLLLLLKVINCKKTCLNIYQETNCEETFGAPGDCPNLVCEYECNQIYLPLYNSSPLSSPVWPPQHFILHLIIWPIINLFK